MGAVYALIALSGSALVFQTPLLRALHPQLAHHAIPDPSQNAAVLSTLATRWAPKGLRASDFPTPALPVWQLYFRDGSRRYLDPADGHLLLTRTPGSDLLLALHDWHTHLLGGKRGEAILGVLGCVTIGLLLSGLWLWWPGRRRLRGSLRPYSQPPTRRWLTWHRSTGVLALPLLGFLTLTGTLMVYGKGTRHALQIVLADAPVIPPPARIAAQTAAINWTAVLDAARRALPGATLHRITLPTSDDGCVVVRAQASGEWHQVGRSRIWLDPYRAQVLVVSDATTEGRGSRLSNAIYPLHSTGVGGPLWKVLAMLCGLLPAFFVTTGFLLWRARTRRRR